MRARARACCKSPAEIIRPGFAGNDGSHGSASCEKREAGSTRLWEKHTPRNFRRRFFAGDRGSGNPAILGLISPLENYSQSEIDCLRREAGNCSFKAVLGSFKQDDSFIEEK